MGEAARKFLDRLVLRVGGTASERARFRCYAEQRLACVNADGAARLVLSFKNHIRRRGGTVVRTARDLRLPQVPEAPVDTHRPREATAVDSAETTIVPRVVARRLLREAVPDCHPIFSFFFLG